VMNGANAWRTTDELFKSTTRPFSPSGCVPGLEFDQSRRRAEEARQDADGARTELLVHKHDHACLTPLDIPGDSRILGMASEDSVLGGSAARGG
jgi:hypothetical protein